VPPGLARGDVITSWVNPTSLTCDVLAVGVCAYLSTIYLTAEAGSGNVELAEYFRRQGLRSGVLVGGLALAAIAVVQGDAGQLYHGLTHRGLPLVTASIVLGFLSLVLLARRHYIAVRISAALSVAAVLWALGRRTVSAPATRTRHRPGGLRTGNPASHRHHLGYRPDPVRAVTGLAVHPVQTRTHRSRTVATNTNK